MSEFRRKLMASNKEEKKTSEIVLYFNGNVQEWFLEKNQTGNNSFYQVGKGELVKLPYSPTWVDSYIKFNYGYLRNTSLTIYNDPSEYYALGNKRRSSGLVKVDFSKFIGPGRWYFWDGGNTYNDLQEFIFPTKFSNQLIELEGYMHNITVPTDTNCVIGSIDKFKQIRYLQEPYNLRIWGGNYSKSRFDDILSNLPTNISHGILGVNSTGYSNLTDSQKQAFAAKNIEIRVGTGNNFYDCDWRF